jgi:hypothetical protein
LFHIFFLNLIIDGRENLESGEIKNNEDDIEIANCENFFLNYINCCAVSLHSVILVIDKTIAETANTY